MAERIARYECIVCRYIYDPRIGNPMAGVRPGVEFETLPGDWVCPECMVGKDQFVMVQGNPGRRVCADA